jgi:hypothetical protein
VSDLLVIVPSRGRPESLERLAAAWDATGAFAESAGLVVAVDDDDPKLPGYHEAMDRLRPAFLYRPLSLALCGPWQPMVAKLNQAAVFAATQPDPPFALGFAGDDHLPRTEGWAGRYLEALREMGTGIVYGDDGLQGEKLPTQWAMTSDIVRALGRMVPAPVDHLYCDNAIRDLGEAAGCLRYLPDVLIEHMHPLAGKAQVDNGYRLVNAPSQYRKDRTAYQRWRDEQLAADVTAIRKG